MVSYTPRSDDGVDPHQRPAERHENEVTDPEQLTPGLWVRLIRRPRGGPELRQRARVVEVRRKGPRKSIQHARFNFPSPLAGSVGRTKIRYLADLGVIAYPDGTWNQNNSIEIDGNQSPTVIVPPPQ